MTISIPYQIDKVLIGANNLHGIGESVTQTICCCKKKKKLLLASRAQKVHEKAKCC